MDRIWIDVSSLRQVNLLCTVGRNLPAGSEVLFTTSGDARVREVMAGQGLKFREVPRGPGSEIESYASRIIALVDLVKSWRPELLISDLDPGAVRTAFGLGVPCWTFFQGTNGFSCRERIYRMTLPLCERVFASSFHPDGYLNSFGLTDDKIVSFRGWNECYLRDHPWQEMLRDQAERSLQSGKILLRARSAQRYQVTLASILSMGSVRLVSWLEDPGDATAPKEPCREISAQPPALLYDLYIGSGRMAAEFFLLGKPVILLPEGRYPDLGLLYRSVLETDDQESIAAAATYLLTEKGRTRARCLGLKVVGRMKSPVAALLAEL